MLTVHISKLCLTAIGQQLAYILVNCSTVSEIVLQLLFSRESRWSLIFFIVNLKFYKENQEFLLGGNWQILDE